jgi:hypothetical protein
MSDMEPVPPDRPSQPSRLRALRDSFLWFGGAFAVWAVVATGQSLYAGVGSHFGYSKEQTVAADVQSCHRSGPVSLDGLGYWWDCAAVVRTPDGRTRRLMLRHSIAGQGDVGKTLSIRERCGNDNSGCTYGRPRNLAWGVLLRLLGIFKFLAVPVLLFVGLITFLGAVLTERAEYRVRVLLGKMVGVKPGPRNTGPAS